MKNLRFILFSSILVVLTTLLWLTSKSDLQIIIDQPIKSISQISALIGTVFFGFELVLISRAKWLEVIFGPLDRIYKSHRYLSIWSVIALVIHATTLILSALPNLELAKNYIIFSTTNLIYGSGIIALYSLIITVFVSVYVNLPYNIWKITHKILALLNITAIYHILTITSDISNNLPLRVWIVTVLTIGIFSLFYKIFAYRFLAKSYSYKVDKILNLNGMTYIEMVAEGEELIYSQGQFAYFTFISNGLSQEEHPFSLISRTDEKRLIIAIKKLGDYTNNVSNIKVGDKVIVRGAFGKFGKSVKNSNKEIWIGAGIGITPFFSMVPDRPTELYYCTKDDTDGIFLESLSKRFEDNSSLKLIHYKSKESGRLTPEIFLEILKSKDTVIRICAPEKMIETFKDSFIENDIPLDNLIFEDFSFF